MDKRQELIKRLRSLPPKVETSSLTVISCATLEEVIAMLEFDAEKARVEGIVATIPQPASVEVDRHVKDALLAEGMMMAANLFDGIEDDYHDWEICDIIRAAAAALTAKEGKS
jgi:hypothetical protein